MPMGIVSDKDFERERANSNRPLPTNPKPIPPAEIITPSSSPFKDSESKGRKEGDVGVPNSLRNLIGSESIEAGRGSALELAAQFGLSPSSVSAYSKGATSTSSYSETPNKPVINKTRLRVQKKAQGRLMSALNSLTDEKIADAKARDIAGIAKDMASIVKDMEPENENNKQANQAQFVVFAPQFRDERQYETIYVKE